MPCLQNWRKWIRQLIMSIYAMLLFILLIVLIVQLAESGAQTHVVGWFVAGLFVLFTLPVSLFGILQHLVHYTNPPLQRYIIRILWMVPIYSVNSWLALKFPEAAIYLDTARECYEAYVIYNFMTYLLSYLQSRQYGHPDSPREFEEHMRYQPPVRLLFPLCYIRPWKNGRSFIDRCKHGVLQYTVIRPVTTIIALICQICGKYDEGNFNFGSSWVYLVFINNVSQAWAMYCLILFYTATKEELSPLRPVTKLLCVKAVVFFSFWQSTVISILVAAGAIRGDQSWVVYTTETVSVGLQDFCICVEMFFAAVAHYFSFSHQPYVTNYTADLSSLWDSFKSMWNVGDVGRDVYDHVRTVGMGIGTVVIRQPPSVPTENVPLLSMNGKSTGSSSHSEGVNGPYTDTPKPSGASYRNDTDEDDDHDDGEGGDSSILFTGTSDAHKLLDVGDEKSRSNV